MSAAITLTLRSRLESTLEIDGLVPDRLVACTVRDIAALPVWIGRQRVNLGEFFDVDGERSARVCVAGEASELAKVDGLGAAMAGGELLIEGGAGRRIGAEMTGGRLEVRGSVGDDAGAAMGGGVLRVLGSAGDRVGAALPGASRGMTGGEIVVSGSAGRDAAARARRGLVVVGGQVGRDAGRAMIAGTLVVFGRTGAAPGRGSKRGSIVAAGGIDVPVTYWYACTYRPPFLRLLMTYLRRQYGLAIDDAIVTGRYRRYCGDAGQPGKGEILEWIGE